MVILPKINVMFQLYETLFVANESSATTLPYLEFWICQLARASSDFPQSNIDNPVWCLEMAE